MDYQTSQIDQSPELEGAAEPLARLFAACGEHLLALVELQAQLLEEDLRATARALVGPLLLAGICAISALGAVVVLLIGLAELLAKLSGLAPAYAYLIVAILAIAATGICLWRAIAGMRGALARLERSRRELAANVSSLGAMWKRRSGSRTEENGRSPLRLVPR